jgi:hypothetical protein
MLHPMQQAAKSTPSPNPQSFAGLLASLTSPKAGPAWNDDGLADDVATLSYENALRAHARYRAPDLTDRSLTRPDPAESVPVDHYELAPGDAPTDLRASCPSAAPQPAGEPCPEAARRAPTLMERNLKSASITIRVSQTECDQLHRRANAAGMTVSAYLRSCTFEAESLRALVRETLAQVRTCAPVEKQPAPAHRSMGARLGRIFTPWRSARMARA